MAGGGKSSPNTLFQANIRVLLLGSSQYGPAVEATFPRGLVRFASVSLSLKSAGRQAAASPSLRLPLAAGTDLAPFSSSKLRSPAWLTWQGGARARLRFQGELSISTLKMKRSMRPEVPSGRPWTAQRDRHPGEEVQEPGIGGLKLILPVGDKPAPLLQGLTFLPSERDNIHLSCRG